MRHAIRKNLRNFIAVVALAVIAIPIGVYILDNQRLRFPLVEDKPLTLKAEFSTAQAVTPGQGQTIRVSGVRIGDIGKVELKDGRAIVDMVIDKEFEDLVHTNAHADLRPKTGLKDMFIDLDPGGAPAPVARKGWTIPIRNTLPDINPDEVFQALDADARDYLRLLVSGGGEGLKDRGSDLRETFRRFEPTHRDLARVTSKVAERRSNLRRLINSLSSLNTELAKRDDDLAELVGESSRVFRAFASEDENVSATIRELPSALRETADTLQQVRAFAGQLGPTADKLRPAVRALDDANKAITPFVKEAAPILRDEVRPFVRNARPVVRSLRPAAERLAKATPDLTGTFKVIDHFFNIAGYNEGGRQGPENAQRDEGYLFYLAWLGHLSSQVFSTGDAHGTFRPVTAGGTCGIIRGTIAKNPETEFLQGLSGVLSDPRICG